MAILSVQTSVEAGITPTKNSAASGGDVFANTGKEYIHVTNGSGSSINVTITAQGTTKHVNGYGTMTKANQVVAVGAGAEKVIGPFPTKAFSNTSGQVELTYSAVTSVTVQVIKVPDVN